MKQRTVIHFDYKDPIDWLAYGFGSGLMPWAPGTFGTIAAIPFYLAMQSLHVGVYLLLVLVGFAAGIWICERASNKLGVHDHGGIVWDEIVGYWVTMSFAPPGWMWILAGFAAFRLFDIIKPWPIRSIDRRIGGGFGIMLDDMIAGLFALALIRSVWWLLGA